MRPPGRGGYMVYLGVREKFSTVNADVGNIASPTVPLTVCDCGEIVGGGGGT